VVVDAEEASREIAGRVMGATGRLAISALILCRGLRYDFDIMKAAVFPALTLLAAAAALHGAINQSCKAGSEDGSILHVHGRLSVYNGGYPNLRLWQIGTHHLFGIYGDPEDLQCSRGGACKGDDDTKLPGSLDRLNLLGFSTYGDFEIRPLESFQQGHMQAACIAEARNIVRRRTD
jgi:hypothetical protein